MELSKNKGHVENPYLATRTPGRARRPGSTASAKTGGSRGKKFVSDPKFAFSIKNVSSGAARGN